MAAAARKALAERNYPLVRSICKASRQRYVVDEVVQFRREADALAEEHAKRALEDAGPQNVLTKIDVAHDEAGSGIEMQADAGRVLL